jgi:hypothetical protein
LSFLASLTETNCQTFFIAMHAEAYDTTQPRSGKKVHGYELAAKTIKDMFERAAIL